MASTPLPALDNLAAKEAESDRLTAYPEGDPVPPGVSTVFANTNASSTTATSGSGTLPGNPKGFIEIAIAGTLAKIPYYDA